MDKVTVKKKSYNINGQSYPDVESMPEKYRKIFEDKDKNGTPDIVDKFKDQNYSTSINIKGKEYPSWDKVPKKYQYLKTEIIEKTTETNMDKPTGQGFILNDPKAFDFKVIIAIGAVIFSIMFLIYNLIEFF